MFLHESGIDFGNARGCCAIALDMHRPLIPTGGPGRGVIYAMSRWPAILQFMQESPYEEDRRNADVLRHCYKRMGEFVPRPVPDGGLPCDRFTQTHFAKVAL